MTERIDSPGPDVMGLSPAALAHKQAMLPGLLGAVRRRRRRQKATRVAALLVLAGVPVALWQPWRVERAAAAPGQVIEASAWTSFGDDPTVLARCEVPDVQRPEWFVDDEQLRQLLAGAQRQSGLVRVGSKVFVAPAAIDEWPTEAP